MKPIIVAESVTKKYSKNANIHRSYGLSDLFRELFVRQPTLELREDEFLAVDDVSFHLQPGESLALVGRNGAGKTTLLKMLNGLIKPDAGTIIMDGTTQALINLGAGFNPALSGRDNIFNSASLLGLGPKEIGGIVDEVIDFAELDEFIDSPVGTYSSGMKARLGFGVAINLRPDILLIDEILSVGDFAFRNKCFVKMHELKKNGVTIVFVSHSHTHVIQLCERALWLHRGKAVKLGPSKETVQAYLEFLDEEEKARVEKLDQLKTENADRQEATKAAESSESLYGPIYDEFDQIENLTVRLETAGRDTSSVRLHDDLVIEYGFTLKKDVTDLNVTLSFFKKDGVRVATISTLNGDLLTHLHSGEVRCRVRIPDFNINPGTYVLMMPIHEGKSYLYRNVVKEFTVTGNNNMTWDIVDLNYDYEVEQSSEVRANSSILP